MISVIVAGLVVMAPAMSKRAISATNSTPYPGVKQTLQVGPDKFTLFIPDSWKPSRRISLYAHFHGPDWHTIQEHIATKSPHPIISSSPGEGSSVYAKLMGTTGTMDAWIAAVVSELTKRGAPEEAQVQELHLSSFSAGYGAIRELVQQPEIYRRIKSVILCDSMYGSLAPEEPRRPLDAHIKVWEALARDAIRQRKTFVVTVSNVPTISYASSSECLDALVTKVNVPWQTPDKKWPASVDPDYPLLRFAQAGQFFAWHYGGVDAGAHTTHIRHLADIRVALSVRN